MDRQTDTQTDRHTDRDRQTDMQTHRQAGRQTHRHSQTHRQTDRQTGRQSVRRGMNSGEKERGSSELATWKDLRAAAANPRQSACLTSNPVTMTHSCMSKHTNKQT